MCSCSLAAALGVEVSHKVLSNTMPTGEQAADVLSGNLRGGRIPRSNASLKAIEGGLLVTERHEVRPSKMHLVGAGCLGRAHRLPAGRPRNDRWWRTHPDLRSRVPLCLAATRAPVRPGLPDGRLCFRHRLHVPGRYRR
jgi:hypothetical protein